MSEIVATPIQPAPSLAKATSVTLKALLVLLLALTLIYPEAGNLRDKGAGVRAIVYPALALTIPVEWWMS